MRGGGPPWGWGKGNGRPPWWPEGDLGPGGAAPADWQRHGRRMVRRIGCIAGVALLVVLSAMVGVVWLLLGAFGVVSAAPFTTAVAISALVLGVIAVAIALRVWRRLAAPVGALIEGAHRIEAGDYSTRVPVRGPADLRSLSRALNSMSSRLEADETRRRSVLADVAHELRTPLTIIRGQAEGIADGLYPADLEHLTPIISATESLEMLVNDLGTLTLAESGALRLQREPVDVAVLVNETVEAFRPEASAAGVQLSAAVEEQVPDLDADPARIRGVLGNLVTNALAHSRRGGSVRVEATAVDGSVRITVRDDGEGIPRGTATPRVRSLREGAGVHRFRSGPRDRAGRR